MPETGRRLPAAAQVRRQVRRLVRGGRRRLGRVVTGPPQPPPPRPATDVDRLVPAPVFVFSAVRSGSTLLRVVLNSHSQITAPHEMHLNRLRIARTEAHVHRGIAALGLSSRDLENLLWDRVLHRELLRSGRSVIVDKTPQNVKAWRRIRGYWPRARYVFLLRHPAHVADSLQRARPDLAVDVHQDRVLRYGVRMDEAMAALPGLTVRYEELTADPEATARRICGFVGVPYEPAMLAYATGDPSAFVSGLGDWSDKIRSGRIQPGRPLPPLDEVPEPLRDLTRRWGY